MSLPEKDAPDRMNDGKVSRAWSEAHVQKWPVGGQDSVTLSCDALGQRAREIGQEEGET